MSIPYFFTSSVCTVSPIVCVRTIHRYLYDKGPSESKINKQLCQCLSVCLCVCVRPSQQLELSVQENCYYIRPY